MNLTIYGEIDGEKWQPRPQRRLDDRRRIGPRGQLGDALGGTLKSALCHLSEKERQAWLATLALGRSRRPAAARETKRRGRGAGAGTQSLSRGPQSREARQRELYGDGCLVLSA